MSAFGSGHDPGVLGLSPVSGSLFSRESAFPSAPSPLMLAFSFSQINKNLLKKINNSMPIIAFQPPNNWYLPVLKKVKFREVNLCAQVSRKAEMWMQASDF